MWENWVVLVVLEVGTTGTASVDSSVAIGAVIVKLCVIFGMYVHWTSKWYCNFR